MRCENIPDHVADGYPSNVMPLECVALPWVEAFYVGVICAAFIGCVVLYHVATRAFRRFAEFIATFDR